MTAARFVIAQFALAVKDLEKGGNRRTSDCYTNRHHDL
jgi:hypothetical protein